MKKANRKSRNQRRRTKKEAKLKPRYYINDVDVYQTAPMVNVDAFFEPILKPVSKGKNESGNCETVNWHRVKGYILCDYFVVV